MKKNKPLLSEDTSLNKHPPFSAHLRARTLKVLPFVETSDNSSLENFPSHLLWTHMLSKRGLQKGCWQWLQLPGITWCGFIQIIILPNFKSFVWVLNSSNVTHVTYNLHRFVPNCFTQDFGGVKNTLQQEDQLWHQTAWVFYS